MRNDFAAFILTHGRAKNIVTHKSLRKHGYTGRIVYVVDDQDEQVDQYRERFGDDVHVFDKEEAASKCDCGNNFGKRNGILFARNASFDIARSLGLKYFWQLDDDYTGFHWCADNNGVFLDAVAKNKVKNLDPIIDAFIDFLDASGAMTVCFAQGGDFIGGGSGRVAKLASQGRFARKAMNSFFCDVDRPIGFKGMINEDVNAYVEAGRRGQLFITVPRLRLTQVATQVNAGGMKDLYLDCGTYLKSFSSVMYAPSCVKVGLMGDRYMRMHHQVRWKNAVPLILSESYRKPRSI